MSRTTVVLLAIAVVLTVQAVFFESRVAPWERAGRVFRELDSQDVLEVEISQTSAERDRELGVSPQKIVLRRDGEPKIWRIAEPIRFPAFHPRVMGIVSELADLVRIAEVPRGVDAFPNGPEISVRMKTRFLGDLSVEFGRDHPDTALDVTYARVGEDVFVTRKAARRALTVSLDELRSRALVPVAAADAVAFRASGAPASSKTIERVPGTDRWRLREPIDASADRERTEDLLRDLNAWSIAAFEKDDAASEADLEPFGLDPPVVSFSVRHRGGFEASLEVGKEFASGGARLVYLRRPGEPFVFSAERGDLVERLLAPAEDYRNRYVFDIWLEEIETLEVDGAAGKFVVRRLPAAEGSSPPGGGRLEAPTRWEIEETGTGNKCPGDPDRIGTLVATLHALPVEKHVGPEVRLEDAGLAPPRFRLHLHLSSGRELELHLGARCEDPAFRNLPVIYVRRPDESGSYLVTERLGTDLAGGVSFFRQRKISELDFTEVLEFQVVDGEESWFLGRVPGDDWTLSAETPIAPGRFLDQRIVERVLRSLDRAEFAVGRYLPQLADHASAGLELAAPRRAIALLEPRDLPGFRKLVIGAPFPEEGSEEVYARVELGGIPAFTLPEAGVPAALDALVRHLREITGK
ncbi:MAG: DUF4340 domain-containing protein [Planctomycetota bacterium]